MAAGKETNMETLHEKLMKLCEKHNTNKDGINYLLAYYQRSLKWNEEEAIKYAIGLFENGTIDEIKITLGGNHK